MRILPPVYFVASAGVMALLDRVAPGPRWLSHPATLTGLAPFIAGAALTLAGAGLFKKHGTAIRPFEVPTTLVTTGPYRYTRNPMYLGMALGLTGVAVMLGTTTPPAVIPIFVWLITTRFIAHEERRLGKAFGQPYLDYKQKVRRWL